MRRAPVIALVLSAASCFGEPGTVETGSDTGEGCPPGTNGCPCDAGACGAMLECNTDYNCVDPECSPGSRDCTCLPGGACEALLVCSDALCKPRDSAAGTGADGDGDGGGSSQGVDDGADAATSIGDSGMADATGLATSGTTDPGSADSDGDPTVDPATDGGAPCGGPCPPEQVCGIGDECVSVAPYDSCVSDGCSAGVTCLDTGKGSFTCAPPCNATVDCPPAPPGMAVHCISSSCVGVCAEGCLPGMGCGVLGPSDVCAWY